MSELISAVLSSPILAGFCYTQLTDTGLEVNGLCTVDRTPKIPVEEIRQIMSDHEPFKTHLRPRLVTAEPIKGTA